MGGSHGTLRSTDSDTMQSQDNTLGLMHLRKLFSELKSPSTGSTQKDLENTLYNMLPLFCKVSPFLDIVISNCIWYIHVLKAILKLLPHYHLIIAD